MNQKLIEILVDKHQNLLTSSELENLFIEGIYESIYRWQADTENNKESSYSDLKKVLTNKLVPTIKKLRNIINDIPEQSLLRVIQNSQTHLRTQLGIERNDKSEFIPSHNKPLFDELNPMFIQLNILPHKVTNLILNTLQSTIEINEKSIANQTKGKQLDKVADKELVYNLAYVFKLLGGQLSYSENSLFTGLIHEVFSHLYPERDSFSASDFLKNVCSGNSSHLHNEIKHKRFLNYRYKKVSQK